MNAPEIFRQMPAAAAQDIFVFLESAEKDGYKSLVSTLAERNRLRPIFVQRKPREERNRWLAEAIARRNAEDLAANVLQVWLVGGKKQMICQFLDGLEIAHDENGMVETLPASPGAEKIAAAVESLFASHPASDVAIYLHAFHAMDENPWQELGALLESDPRLSFQATPQ